MNQVRTAVYSFVYNLQLAANPQIIKSYSSGDLQWFYSLISLVSRAGYALMLMMGLPMILNMDYVLDLWLVSVPEYAVQFCRLILIFCIVDSLTGPLWVAMQASGKISFYTLATGFAVLLNLPLSYVALKAGYEPASVYLIQIFLCAISLVIKLLFVRSKAGLSLAAFFKEVILPLLAVTVVSVSATWLAGFWSDGIFKLLITLLVSFLSVSASMFYIGLKPGERLALKAKIRSWLRR